MTGEVKIEITSIHTERDNAGRQESQKMYLTAIGNSYEKSGSTYILFEEKQEDMEIVKNLIKIMKESIIYRKKGSISSEILLEQGREHKSVYQTVFGGIGVTVKAGFLETINEDKYIRIRTNYELTMEESYTADCEMDILITKIEPKEK